MASVSQKFRLKALCTLLLISACTTAPPPPRQAMPQTPQAVAPVTQAPAALGCVRTEETLAVQTATLKQRLMIAGFVCKAADPYNKFIVAYREDLQESDRALLNLFRRLQGPAGERGYDSFKTRVANISMHDSAGDPAGYCANADATFREAMAVPRKPLRTFIAGQTIKFEEGFAPCELVASTFQ